MKMKDIHQKIVFYDVDTQNDFMNVDGLLYVPNAAIIKPNLAQLTQYANNNGITILGSVDNHADGDAEFIKNGGPFPDHCMADTEGQEKIPETEPSNPSYIPNIPLGGAELYREYILGDSIFFEKQHYDVFTNPHAESVLSLPKLAVVYGVATDYCIKAAALGMRQRGVNVIVVEDAIEGIAPESIQEALEEMRQKEVKFIKTQDVLDGKVEKIFANL